MYNPYQGYYTPINRPTLPQQQIIQVNGKSSVDTIQLAPNSSILVMDTSAPIVWLCVSDGVGKVTSTPYDITLHKETPAPDMASIETRISNIENTIAKWEALNHEPNVADTKSKSNQSRLSAD